MSIKSAPNHFNLIHLPDNQTLHDYVLFKASNSKDEIALIDGPTGVTITYAEIVDKTHRLASALIGLGLEKGDVFAIQAVNHILHPVVYLAVLAAGGIVTTINPLYTETETKWQLKDCSAKFILTQPDIASTSLAAARACGIRHFFSLGEVAGCRSLQSVVSGDDGSHYPPPRLIFYPREDVAFYLYSSGTTGLPKAVMLTHYNIVANLEQIRSSNLFNILPSEIALTMFPFFHVGGVVCLLNSMRVLGTLVIFQKFQPEPYIRLIERYKVNILLAAPPIAVLLVKHPLVDAVDLSSLYLLYIGAAPLGQELSEQIMKRIPSVKDICQAYGMTELSPLATAAGRDGVWKHGSGGILVPNTEGKVIDIDTGKCLGPNVDGEICIRGPQVMKGYLNKPEATASTIDSQGFLHTGDIGHYDEEGYFFIVDRLKELIKYNAYQVAPAELEDLLMKHVSVSDCGVVGVPDLEHGELPRAYVVKKPGETVTDTEIQTFVEKHVAPYKRLRGGVKFIPEIPKTQSGKVLRRVLKQMAVDEAKKNEGNNTNNGNKSKSNL